MKKMIILFMVIFIYANSCKDRVFSLSIKGDNSIKLQTLITDLSDTCHLNVFIPNDITQKKLNKNIKYLKLSNVTLKKFLDFILTKQGFFYTLNGNVLNINYIKTKTFKVDYINSTMSGTTNFSASTQEGEGSNTLNSSFNFDFWNDFTKNINNILTAQSDSTYKNPDPIIDKTTGLVTITGTKSQLNRVKKYIDELNYKLHKEVVIDVKIYSVKLSKSNVTGINWSKFNLSISNSTPVRAANIVGSTSIFSKGLFNVDGLLNFLSTYGQVNSISNPKIATLNNQKAIITVGQTINYSYTTVTTDANGNAVQSNNIGSKFVGMLLDITPEISDNNVIIMSVNPSISSIDATTLNQNLPPNTYDKKLNTIVRVKDGDTIVLGGLITDETSFQRNGVPVLKEVPLVKYLFSSKEKISSREELIFVLTPHIIDLNKKESIKKAYKLPSLGEF